MDILPFVEGWRPGAPVCTGEQFDAILTAAGKGAGLPGFEQTAYFLAQTANDPAEKGRRWQAILSARLRYSTADHDPEMEQAIAKDHNAILAITAGEMRQDALDELRAIVPQTEQEAPDEVDAFAMSSIATQSVDWVVPYLLPRGEISVLGGDGGVGKGIWTAQLIAYVTTGRVSDFFPAELPAPGVVLILSGEDDPAKVLRPRLLAAGADMERVKVMTADLFFEQTGALLSIDSEAMKKMLARVHPDLIVVDPYQAFLREDVKMADRNQMRSTTTPFRTFCREVNAAGLFCAHSNKKGAVAGRQRLADSADLWDIARCVLMMGRAREEQMNYISNEKNSYAAPAQTALFTIEGTTAEGAKTARAVFRGRTDRKDADFIFERTTRQAGTKDAAQEAIMDTLEKSKLGSMDSSALRKAVMEKTGCSKNTYYTAFKELKGSGRIENRPISSKDGAKHWIVCPRAGEILEDPFE